MVRKLWWVGALAALTCGALAVADDDFVARRNANAGGCSGDCTFSTVRVAQGSSVVFNGATGTEYIKDDGFGSLQINGVTDVRIVSSTFNVNGTMDVGKNSQNQCRVGGASTGNPVGLTAVGGDTNINIKLTPKGTGGVIQAPNTLQTCTAGLEGLRQLVAGSGGNRTKICVCTTDGTTPAWVNVVSGTVGNTTSCNA